MIYSTGNWSDGPTWVERQFLRDVAPSFKGGVVEEIQLEGVSLLCRVHVWCPDGVMFRARDPRPDDPFLVSPATFEKIQRLDDRRMNAPTSEEGEEC